MTDLERLSRLLDGELPEEEAAPLRARLDREPELRAALEAMRGLPGALASLPLEAPPPSVTEAALGLARGRAEVQEARPARRVPAWAPALALVAAALLALALWPERPALTLLTEGQQLVDGRLSLLAGDVAVQVDGRALVTVEPPRPAARGMGVEDPKMKLERVSAALGGALVTVAVYEGSALLRPADGAAVAVQAGETRALRGGAEVPATRTRKEGPGELRGGATPAPPPATLAEAQARIATLEQELAAARLEGAVSRGQLKGQIGSPQAWPEDPPEATRPEVWEKNLKDALARHGAGSVVSIDCQEYPCVAILEPKPGVEDWKGPFEDAFADLSTNVFRDNASVHAMASASEDGEKTSYLMGVAIYPGDDGDEDTKTRTNYRLSTLMDDEANGEP